MGGRPAACCRGFPSCYFHTLCWLGGVAGWNMTPEVVRGSAHCWVLRRHLAGWWVVFSGGRSRPGPSNASRGCPLLGWVGVVVVVVGFGVWWCVECCIVDASIFILCLVLWFVRVCCV